MAKSYGFDGVEPFYTHQHIELPKIQMEITPHVLHKGQCRQCGQVLSIEIPKEHQTGHGP